MTATSRSAKSAPPRLEEFALLSVEFANLPQAIEQNAGREDYVARAWLELLQVRANEFGAQLERVHQHRVFLIFTQEPTVVDSVEAAVQMARQLVEFPIQIFDCAFQVRMGLALEHAASRNPLSAVTERSLASIGQLVLPRELAQRVGLRRYGFGPLHSSPKGSHKPILLEGFLQLDFRPEVQAVSNLKAQHQDTLLASLEQPMVVVQPDNHYAPQAMVPPATVAVDTWLETDLTLVGVQVDALPLASTLQPLSKPPLPPTEALGYVEEDLALAAPSTVTESLLPPPFPPAPADIQALDPPIASPPPPIASPPPQTALSLDEPLASIAPPLQEAALAPVLAEPPPAQRPDSTLDTGDDVQSIADLFNGQFPPLPAWTGPTYFSRIDPSEPPLGQVPYLQVLPRLTSWLQGFHLQSTCQGRLLVLEGTAGIGKSTLLQMARLHLDPASQQPSQAQDDPPAEPPFLWIQGGPLHHGPVSPVQLEVWHQAIRSLFNLPLEGVPLTYAQQHVESVLNQVVAQPPVDGDTWAFWQDWFGLGGQPPTWDSVLAQRPDRCFHYWRTLLIQLARIKPVILILDNLDQADAASQALLVQLLQSDLLAQAPIALVLTKGTQTRLDGPLAQTVRDLGADVLSIAPLTDAEVVTFLDQGALAGQAQTLPNVLIQQLTHSAGGLPLMLEEYLRYLSQHGLLQPDPETGALKPVAYEALGQVQLPGSLSNLLQQRSQSLSDASRQLLQVASVLGTRFAPSTLMGLCQLDEPTFQTALQQLWEQGWVVPDVANDLAFRHSSLRDYFYVGTPETMRQQLHQLVYQSLSAGYSEPTLLSPALLAHHAQLGQLTAEWHDTIRQAGLQAGLTGSVVGANLCLLPLLERLAAAPELTAQHTQLINGLISLNQGTQPEFALALMERLIAERSPAIDLDALRQLANLYEWNGRFVDASRSLALARQQAMTMSELSISERLSLCLHQGDLGLMQGYVGQVAHRLQHDVAPLLTRAQTALSFEEQAEYRLQAFLQQFQVSLAQTGGLPEAGQIQQAQEWIVQTGNQHAQLGLMLQQARAAQIKGHQGQAHQLLNQLLPLMDTLEQSAYYFGQWGLIAAQCHVDVADVANARLVLPNTQLQAEATRDYNTLLLAQVLEGRIHLQQQQWLEAGQLLEHTLKTSLEVSLLVPALRSWHGLMTLHLERDQPGEALAIAQQAIAMAEQPRVMQTLLIYELALGMAKARMALGEIAEAGALLQQYWPGMSASRCIPLIAEAAWVVAQLHFNTARQSPAQRGPQMEQGKRYYERALQLWQGLGNTYQRSKVEQGYRHLLIRLDF